MSRRSVCGNCEWLPVVLDKVGEDDEGWNDCVGVEDPIVGSESFLVARWGLMLGGRYGDQQAVAINFNC